MAAFGTIPDPSNPNDPSQISNWAIGVSRANADRNLYDPETMKQLSAMFGPYFKQMQANYTQKAGGALNSQVSQAVNQAGAMAAFKGLNPSSFTQAAGGGVRHQMAPSYMSGLSDLITGQQGSLLSATAGSNQFKSNNANAYAQMLMGKAQMAQEDWNRPDFWDYLGSGLAQGISKLPMMFMGGA